MELRPYQRQAIDATYSFLTTKKGNPLLVLPTGTGKSVVLATFLKETIAKHTHTRFVVATHSKELVEQDYNELLDLWPGAPAGILSAGLRSRNTQAQIIFAGIQTAYDMAFKIQRCDALVSDESHTIPHKAEGMWRRFIDDLTRINPHMRTVGLTATGYRLDSGLLTKGPTRLFTDVAYEYKLLDAIKEGYLCEIVPAPTNTHLSTKGVHKRGGEFVAGELERAVDQADTTQAACAEIVRLGFNRKSWLIFCAGIKHTEHVRDALRALDISAEMVTAKTPNGERDRIILDFKQGRVKALCNTGVLTTGFNHPPLDLIACLRPTGSAGLWVQMLGRGMRLSPGKSECMLLDFAHNGDRFGPIDQIRGKDYTAKGEGEAPQKICDKCHCYCWMGTKTCPDCGWVFPAFDINSKLSATASNAAILSTQIKPQSLAVKSWRLIEHEKPGKPLSMRVEYNLGISKHSEYVTIQNFGEARNRAVIWWAKHKGQLPPPTLVSDAISRQKELTMPRAIILAPNGKYQEIVGREW